MKVEPLVKSINQFLEGDTNEFVSLDLGAKYIKGALVKDNKIRKIFAGQNSSSGVKSALDLLKEHSLEGKKVKVALKGPDTIIRYVPFPKVEKGKLKEALTYELSKYVPFSSDSVYFDAAILDDKYSNEEYFILLAVAKKENVDSLLSEFEQGKANVTGITLGSISLLNLFSLANKDDVNLGILDMGFSSTLLSLVKKGMPYLSREIKISGKSVMEKLAQSKNIDKDEVEKILIEGSQEDIVSATEELLVELAEEVRNSFDYFEMNVGEQVQEVLITGGFSTIKGIDENIGSHLGVQIKVWDPYSNIKLNLPKDLPLPKEMLGVVAGLSL